VIRITLLGETHPCEAESCNKLLKNVLQQFVEGIASDLTKARLGEPSSQVERPEHRFRSRVGCPRRHIVGDPTAIDRSSVGQEIDTA